MGQELDTKSLLSSLRAERRMVWQDPALYSPNKCVELALEHLTQEIQEGKRDGFKVLLQGCLETDNPKGAAAALIDRLMPPQKTRRGDAVDPDGGDVGYYRTPPLETLEISNALRLTRSDTLVDIGGGNGTTAAIFALLNPEAAIISLELEEELVQQAKALKEQFNLNNLTVVQEDALTADLSFASALYLYFPFDDRRSSRFVEKFDHQRIPHFVLRGNCPGILIDKLGTVSKSSFTFQNEELSWWRGNIRGR